MNRKFLLSACLSLFVVASASAFAPFDDKDSPAPKLTGDLAKLQGKWTGKFGPDGAFEAKITIKGKEMEFKIVTPDGQDFVLNGEIKVDEKAKPHKTVDWVNFKTPNGDDIPDNLGIYQIEDDNTVKGCFGGPSNARPTEFKSEDGGQQMTTLKRVVEKPKEPAAPKAKSADPEKK